MSEPLKAIEPNVVELDKQEALDLLSWLTQIRVLEKDLAHSRTILALMQSALREKYGVEETWSWKVETGQLVPLTKEEHDGE